MGRCRLRCLGVVLQANLEQEGVVFTLQQRLDDHAGAICHADYRLGPRQALGVAEGDVRVRRAEHANYLLPFLLSLLGHREGSRRAGVRQWPRLDIWDVRGSDGASLPCDP